MKHVQLPVALLCTLRFMYSAVLFPQECDRHFISRLQLKHLLLQNVADKNAADVISYANYRVGSYMVCLVSPYDSGAVTELMCSVWW